MAKHRTGEPRPMTYRSLVGEETCKHSHPSYRTARDCGYKRERAEGSDRQSSVVDRAGNPIAWEAGAALDAAAENAVLEARQVERRAEINKLRSEQYEIDRQQWWNPNRPRGRGIS